MPSSAPSAEEPGAVCATCGGVVPRGAPFGLCPRCLFGLGSGVMPEALPDEKQPRGFGDYELIEEIARGGMGVVYRARQLSLGREVALKMILAGELATPESVQRFRNEASAAARLEHPNIVSVFEIGEHETQHFFSMRLVTGSRNVAAWAKALALSPQERARQIAAMMAKVARAVAFAHERGVLHRDLKPSNILVDEKGEPQVTDFGLAKIVSEHDSAITASAALLGSPSYMAPEQAEGRHRHVTTATDVYGLGAVLYELLAGRPPFVGASPLATARAVVEQMPEHLAGAPRDLETLCRKCLEKEPGRRYASALALAEDLERFARGEPIRARPVSSTEALWLWARRRPKIAALLGAVVVAFLTGFAGVTWQWRRAERANAEQAATLKHLRWLETARQAGTNDAPIALAKIATRLREQPADWQAAMMAMSVVDQRAFPLLVGPPVEPEGKFATPPRLAPDGAWFAAVGEDQILRVWESASGAEKNRVTLTASATALAVSAGPLGIVTALDDGRVQARATAEAAPIELPRGGGVPVQSLAFSIDGAWLMARSKERVEVWSSAAPATVPVVFTLPDGVAGAALSADGARVLAWNAKRAALWDTRENRALAEAAPEQNFRRGALSAGGHRFALIDGAFTAAVWDDTGARIRRLVSPLTPFRLATLNTDGTRLTLAGNANELSVYDTDSGVLVSPPDMRHLYVPQVLETSPDGTRVASFAYDGRAMLWDAATGRSVLGAISLGTDLSATLSLSADGRVLLVLPEESPGHPPRITVWRGAATRPPARHAVDGQRNFASARVSPDGRLGCIGLAPEFRAHVFDLATGRVVLDAPANGDLYVHLFSPDMRRYYALTANGWLHGWSLETGAPLWPPAQQPGAIRPGALSPDGARIVAGHADGHIRISDTATGQLVQTLEHPGEIKTLRFAPDRSGRFLSGSTDQRAHLWDLRTGARLQTFTGHSHTIIASAWSPDSRRVATASYDQTARLWDAATGRPIGAPMPHLAWLAHLEFSPDGRVLATASRDGTVRLWDARTAAPLSPPLPQASTARTVRFTRDGACFLVQDHLGFRFWNTARAEPATVHYSEPISSGVGMDAESTHAILAPDDRGIFLATAMVDGAWWTVPQPRTAVPPWFPDFLEGLALTHIAAGDTPRLIPGDKLLPLRARLARAPERDEYTLWARRVLGVGGVER